MLITIPALLLLLIPPAVASLVNVPAEGLRLFSVLASIVGSLLLLGLALLPIAWMRGFYPKGSFGRLTFSLAYVLFLIVYIYMVLVGHGLNSWFFDNGIHFDFDLIVILLMIIPAFQAVEALGELIDERKPWKARLGFAIKGKPLNVDSMLLDFNLRTGKIGNGAKAAKRAYIGWLLVPFLVVSILSGYWTMWPDRKQCRFGAGDRQDRQCNRTVRLDHNRFELLLGLLSPRFVRTAHLRPSQGAFHPAVRQRDIPEWRAGAGVLELELEDRPRPDNRSLPDLRGAGGVAADLRAHRLPQGVEVQGRPETEASERSREGVVHRLQAALYPLRGRAKMARRTFRSYIIMPVIFVLIVRAVLTSLNEPILNQAIQGLQNLDSSVFVIGGLLVIVQFCRGSYRAGSFSRLCFGIIAAVLTVLWTYVFISGMTRINTLVELPGTSFQFDLSPFLQLFLIIMLLWSAIIGLRYLIEYGRHRTQWLDSRESCVVYGNEPVAPSE